MVWIETKQMKVLSQKKMMHSGHSRNLNKETNFPEEKKSWNEDIGNIDLEDHQTEERTKEDLAQMRYFESQGLI